MRRLSYRKMFKRYGAGALTVLALLFIAAIITRTPERDASTSGHTRTAASLDMPKGAASQDESARISEAYGRLPLSFEANEGQVDRSVKFISRGQGYGLFLTASEAVLALRQDEGERDNWQGIPSPSSGRAAALRMKLAGASPEPQVYGQEELAGKSNYFIGDDPQGWRTNIKTYGKVRYEAVYPGIDLVYYGNQRQLEYDFILAPGARAEKIAINFEGAENLRLSEEGELVIQLSGGEVRQHRPFIYQERDGRKVEVAGHYIRRGEREVGFEVGAYDESLPLVIDPVLVYSTYLGGVGNESAYGITVDAQGNAYITGSTSGLDFPVTPGVIQPSPRPVQGTNTYYSDAFITKLNATGTALVYSTYLGGSLAGESGKGIAVDGAGNAFIAGTTGASISENDFPTVNALQSSYGGTDDAFLTKLNPTGSAIIFSTYLGGSNSDGATRVEVNRTTGEAFVVGGTSSGTFPTTPGVFMPSACPTQPCNPSGSSVFVGRFSGLGAPLYLTLIGKGYAYDVAVDAANNAYITGTAISGFPTTPGAFQPVSGGSDSFVTKMNPTGTALVYSTFLGGGPQSDSAFGIDIDAEGNAYVTGQTQSTGFPTTPGAFDTSYNGTTDAFVTKFNSTGTALIYSTFLGSSGQDVARSIKVDQSGHAYITGQTRSDGFPARNSLLSKTGYITDIFLTKFNPAGSSLVFSSLLGAGDGRDVALDAGGVNAYLTGEAIYIPVTPGVFQPQKNRGITDAGYDAFAMKIGPADEAAPTYTISGTVTNNNNHDPYSPFPPVITLTGTQNRTTVMSVNNTFSFGALPTGDYTVTVTKPGYVVAPASASFPNLSANQSVDFAIQLNQAPTANITSPANGATFNVPGPVTITADASDPDGTISRVDFSVYSSAAGSIPIGSDATPPYSIDWTNVPAGLWRLDVNPVDNLGRKGTQQNYIFITVNGAGPSVTLTNPTEGSSFPARTWVQFRANATPSGGTQISYVEFYLGANRIAIDNSWPYMYDMWITEPGAFAVTARAVDNIGGATTSSPVQITVTPPPPPGITGRVTTNFGGSLVGVKMTLSGAQSAVVYTDAAGEYTFPNLVAGASYRISPEFPGYGINPIFRDIPALDAGGADVDFVATQITPVSADITRPYYNESFMAPANIPIEATAQSSAGTITKVDFYANSDAGLTMIGTDNTAPYSITWTGVQEGYYTLHVVATDSTGQTGQSGYHFTSVYPPPDTVQLHGQITDGNGNPMENLTVTLTGTQSAVTSTSFFGYYSFRVQSGGDYTITPPPQYTFTPPSYTVTNVTSDTLDLDFTTTQVNTPPVVVMTSPPDGATYTMPADITVSANATDTDGTIARVTFFATLVGGTGGASLGADTLAPYTVNWGVQQPGVYDVFATARDNSGLTTTSAPVRITVNPPPPGSISGRVVDRNSLGIPGVLMTLSGGATATALTDLNGNYAFTNLPSLADYTVTPARLNFTFSPQARTVNRLIGNQTADFTATLVLQPSDFDGDGQTDVAVYRPSTGVWYVLRGRDNVILTLTLGSQSHGDRAVPGNYDGDEQTDIAVFSSGDWQILSSSGGAVRAERFGMTGDKAVPADYDGDGKTDLAVWRPSEATWYVLNSSNNSLTAVRWGVSDDVPAPGDYDGDGQCDIAVFRPSNGYWYIQRSSDQSFAAIKWGMTGDAAVAADYDGDDKTDLAVFRPGNSSWYVRLSSTGTMMTHGWGTGGDVPVPGDYDLDGKADIAVFRPGNGYWYIHRSSTQTVQMQYWGMSGDVPVPFAYLPQ